jgi:Phage integrase, N-terminal SAM-like domain
MPQKRTVGSSSRTRLERGLYRRNTKSGQVYDVVYLDENGRQRWRTCEKLQEARTVRGDLVSRAARGEVVAPTKMMFAELAESWFASKEPRVRRRTERYYRDALDLVLLPRFGKLRLGAIDADAIAKLIRDLEREGLHAIDPERPLGPSSVSNYLKALRAVRDRDSQRRVKATLADQSMSDNHAVSATDGERDAQLAVAPEPKVARAGSTPRSPATSSPGTSSLARAWPARGAPAASSSRARSSAAGSTSASPRPPRRR